MSAEGAAIAPSEVKTWRHARKGRITGRIVAESGDFVDIEVVEPARLSLLSAGVDPSVEPGEVLTVRREFLTEVTP